MPEPHIITADELLDWLRTQWQTFASSSGLNSSKRLEAAFTGEFKVTNKGDLVYLGTSRVAAVRAYNELP